MASQQSQQPDGPHASGGEAGDGGGQEAGAQEPSAEGGIRAAERSAERAAALAATEGFHPLRLRPYVGAPQDDPGASTVRPLLAPSAGGPDTADLGLFPETFAEFAADGDEPYENGGSGPHEAYPEYAGHPGGYGEYAGGYGDEWDTASAVAAEADARGRHRRRRRGLVVAAAAVAASALAAGAVAVTGQVMGGEQGAAGQALPDLTTSVPDVTLPSDASPATAGAAQPVAHPLAATTTPATRPATPPPTPSPRPSRTATTPASPTASPAATPTGTSGTSVASDQGTADAQVLRRGDSGPAVADLQRLLTKVLAYHGPIDGVFDRKVEKAVITFQVWYWVSDAPDGAHDGVYGPKTRAALEAQAD